MFSNKIKLIAAVFLCGLISIALVAGLGMSVVTALQTMLAAVVVIPAAVGVSGYVFRYPVREKQSSARIMRNKHRTAAQSRELRTHSDERSFNTSTDDLVWYELKPQSIQAETSRVSVEALTQAVMSLDTSTGTTPSEIRSRPLHAINLRRAESGIVSVFIGTSRLDATSAMQTFAQNSGYSAELLDHPPVVGQQSGFVVASRPKRIDHMSVSEAGREVQGTIRALAGSRENKFVGNVLLTFEGARDFEIKRFMGFSNEQAIEYGGEMNKSAGGSSTSGGVGGKTSAMAHSLLRTTMVVTADSASGESARSAFSTIAHSMSSLPFALRSHNVEEWHKKKSIIALSGYAGLAAGVGLLQLLPVFVLAMVSAPVIAATVTLAVSPNWLVHDPMTRSLKKGYAPVPVASAFSARWFFSSIYASFRRNAGSSERVDNEIAWPSPPEVIPFYASPVAEFIMPNKNALENNQTRDRIPYVELERDYEYFSSSADIIGGLTSKKQPINWSVHDQNLGIAGMGRPNSGKTNFMHYAFLRNAQMSVSRRDEFKVSPILFENKGPGAYDMWKWINHMPGAELFETNRPKSKYRLALEGPRLGEKLRDGSTVSIDDALDNISQFIDQIVFAFAMNEMPRAQKNVARAVTIAALLNAEELENAGLSNYVRVDKPNIPKLALLILGQDSRIELTKYLVSLTNENDDEDQSLDHNERERRRILAEMISLLATDLDRRDVREIMESAISRLEVLMTCPMFDPIKGQTDIGMEHIITKFAPTIINFGPYRVGTTEDGEPMMSSLAKNQIINRTMKMTQHAYWHYKNTRCAGWQSQNKFSQIYSDEASLFGVTSQNNSGEEESVVAHIQDQGRARGASQMLLTQRYATSHISPVVMDVMKSSPNFFQFPMSSVKEAEQAIEVLGGEEYVPYTVDNMVKMPLGVGAGYLTRDNQRTNTFTVLTPPIDAIAPFIVNKNGNVTDKVDVRYIHKAMLAYYKKQATKKRLKRSDVGDREIERRKQRSIEA